jgi:hypothetical protein
LIQRSILGRLVFKFRAIADIDWPDSYPKSTLALSIFWAASVLDRLITVNF